MPSKSYDMLPGQGSVNGSICQPSLAAKTEVTHQNNFQLYCMFCGRYGRPSTYFHWPATDHSFSQESL